MSLTTKNGIYYVVFRDLRGKVNSRSLHTRDEAEAKREEKKFLFMLRESRRQYSSIRNFPLLNALQSTTASIGPTAAPKRLKLDKMLAIAAKKKKISDTGRKYWELFLKRLKSYRYADEITPKIALNYLESYYDKGNGKTYNNAKSYLNGIFKYCLMEANLEQSPFAPIANRLVDQSEVTGHRNLTDDEIDKVLPELTEDIQIMTMLSRWTAQRLETCARMIPAMFELERKVFIIKPSKTARFNKYVCCPIMPELEKYIKPYLQRCTNANEPIVFQIRGSERSNEAMSKAFLTALKRCNIVDTDEGKASFHSLRGSAITYFKNLGMSSDDLRLITGHTTDEMEAKYDRSSEQISRFARGVGKL